MVLVDTDVLAYLMIEGDRTALAQQLLTRDPDWRSEAFILVELSNILATYIRARALARERALELLAEAEAVVPILTTIPHARALEAAAQHEISAYDGAPRWTMSLADAVQA